MLLIMENIKLALASIKANKMRSFLTMLGIIIGISSVITIASLGETSKKVLGKEFQAFGKNRVFIYLKGDKQLRDSDYFTVEDIGRIKERFGSDIAYLAPSTNAGSDVMSGRNKAKVSINGVGEGYTKMANLKITTGRFLNEGDVKGRRNVGVANKKMTTKLFGNSDPLGKEVKMIVNGNPASVVIVGVYEDTPSIFSGMMSSDSTTFYMPYTVFPSQLNYMPYLDFKIDESKSSIEVANQVEAFIAKSKGREPSFYGIESTQKQQGTMDNILGTLSLAIGAIAAISLVVGGIGIMNIMLVSVTERTKEIGIRKSLGARRKDILLQFLVEAMLVSATGGIIGTTLGLIFSSSIALFLKVTPVIDPKMVIISIVFSAVVGMFFGIYPANRAAKLDPIDALRYE